MAVFAAIAFATFFLENDHFFTFYERCEHLTYNLGTLYNGSTYFNCIIGLSEEHTVKFDLVTFFNCFAEIVNIQELFRLGLELLSLNFYDSVHLLIICFTGYSGGRMSQKQGLFPSLLLPVTVKIECKVSENHWIIQVFQCKRFTLFFVLN